jgi:hypothetical protein
MYLIYENDQLEEVFFLNQTGASKELATHKIY